MACNEEGHRFITLQGSIYLVADAIRQMAHPLDLHEEEPVRLVGGSQRLALTAR